MAERVDGGSGELERAYARGDFARVRELLAAAGAAGQGPQWMRAATSVDPVHAAVIALCALGFAVVVLRYGL